MSITDYEAVTINAWSALVIMAVAALLCIYLGITFRNPLWFFLIGPMLFAAKGFVIIQPGDAMVTTLFGNYNGTVSNDGFFFINPFASGARVSLRVENTATPVLKVNDHSGNPIEIGASIVWEVDDAAKAIFSVNDYGNYIRIQAEAALRQVAASRPYDADHEVDQPAKSLRGDRDAVVQELIAAIEEVIAPAGLRVIDARIAHLAYAPEIAGAMLKRQQAEQVLLARQKIVEGAVSMVKTVVQKLEEEKIVTLSQTDRVSLVTNLMTVLVSDSEAQPVLNMSTMPIRNGT